MRPVIPKFAAAFCAAALFAVTIPLSGQAKEDVCKADAERLCKGIEPGEGRILKCLQEHEADLSPACRETVSAWVQRLSEGPEPVLPACKQDAARLCQGVAPGQGRIAVCLKEHEAELSQECKEAVAAKAQKAQETAEAVAPACRQFVDRFCKDVTPGQGRIAVCLKAHASELSPECRQALAGKAEKKRQKTEQKIERTKKKAEKKVEKTQENAGIQPQAPAEATGER